MKKIILSVAAVFAFGFSNAQETVSEGFAKGDVFISGAVGFGSQKTGNQKANGFEIAPSVGYFVTENIAIGVRLGYLTEKLEYVEEGFPVEIKNNSFTVGAFGRYYFTPASKFSFFGELGVDYVNIKSEVVRPFPSETKTDGLAVQVAPGISYFLTKNLALEASFGVLGFATTEPDYEGAEKTNTFRFGLDTRDINLGLVYKF